MIQSTPSMQVTTVNLKSWQELNLFVEQLCN